MEDPEYKGQDIWELGYVSTSDSDDNDTADDEVSDDEQEESKEGVARVEEGGEKTKAPGDKPTKKKNQK